MRKKLVWLLAAVMAVSSVMLGGCGGKKVTAEGIVQEVNANMEKIKSFSGDMNMDMTIGFSDGTEEQEMALTASSTLEATTDPVITHMKMRIEMDLLGMSVDSDVYTQIDGDTTTSYTGVAGMWTKTEQTTPDAESVQELYAIAGDGTDMTLAEKTEKVGDKEVYVLTSIITGEEFQSMMNTMGNMTQGIDMDMSAMEANVTMKVFKDSMMPASVSIEMKDAGEGIEVDGIVVKMAMLMTVNYNEFDTVESITIPEEALAAETMDIGALTGETAEVQQ